MDALQMLQDRAAILELIVRCANAADNKDLATIEASFVPGAPYDGGMGSGTVEHFLTALAPMLEKVRFSTHLVGNQIVNIDDDRATSDCCVVVYSRTVAGEDEDEVLRDTTAAYRYFDHLARTGNGWRIAKRRVLRDWTR